MGEQLVRRWYQTLQSVIDQVQNTINTVEAALQHVQGNASAREQFVSAFQSQRAQAHFAGMTAGQRVCSISQHSHSLIHSFIRSFVNWTNSSACHLRCGLESARCSCALFTVAAVYAPQRSVCSHGKRRDTLESLGGTTGALSDSRTSFVVAITTNT